MPPPASPRERALCHRSGRAAYGVSRARDRHLRLRVAGTVVIAAVSAAAQSLPPCVGTLAGTTPAAVADGGPAVGVLLETPAAVAVAPDGAGVLVAESTAARVLLCSRAGVAAVIAGGGGFRTDTSTGPASLAGSVGATSIAVHPITGDIVYAEQVAHAIRIVRSGSTVGDGSLGVVAGVVDEAGDGADGANAVAAATLNVPSAVAFHPATYELYIADYGNGKVRRVVPPAGTFVGAPGAQLRTVAGVGATGGSAGDGGPATLAELNGPQQLAFHPVTLDLYISEIDGVRVRIVSAATGVISKLVGVGSRVTSGDGGPVAAATIEYPWGLAFLPHSVALSPSGDTAAPVPTSGYTLLIATESRIRAVNLTSGIITTFMGSGTRVSDGDGGPAASAHLNFAATLAVEWSARLPNATSQATGVPALGHIVYVGDMGGNVRKVTIPLAPPHGDATHWELRLDPAAAMVTTVAGVPASRAFPNGGAATSTYLSAPRAAVLDSRRDLLIADDSLGALFRVFAANGSIVPVTRALGAPESLLMVGATATDDRVLVADRTHRVVYSVGGAGAAPVIIAFDGRRGYTGDGGSALNATAISPFVLAWLGSSSAPLADRSLLVVDLGACVVRRLDIGSYIVTTLAGTGSCGAATDGAAATASKLLDPSGLASSPDGLRVFIAETSTSRILVVNVTSGVLRVLAGDGTPNSFRDAANPLQAQFASPTGLLYSTVRNALLIADSSNSRVRAYSLVNGAVTTVVGGGTAVDGGDGLPPLQVRLQAPTGLYEDAQSGSLLIADMLAATIRVVTSTSTATFCPSGFSCRCGTPLPCASAAAGYCPTNVRVPVTVSSGYYAVVDAAALSRSPLSGFTGQRVCPVGSYCAGGSRLYCWPGSYGVAPMQLTPESCAQCAPGSYAPLAGATTAVACRPCAAGTYAPLAGSSVCTPCPAGTASASLGAASASTCTVCPPGTTSLAGASACAVLVGGARLTTVGAVATFQRVVVPSVVNSGSVAVAALQASAATPLAALGLLPILALLVLRLSDPGSCTHRRLIACLRSVDAFALRHRTAQLASPVKRSTSMGGACTVFALSIIAALSAALIAQFSAANALLQSSVLPAPLPTLASLAALPVAGYTSAGSGSVPSSEPVPFTVGAGFAVSLTAMGPRCGVVRAWAATELLAGSFALTSTVSPDSSAIVRHLWRCEACAFGPLSRFDVTLDRSCQSLTLHFAAVGAAGTLTTASVTAVNPAPVRDARGVMLSRVDVAVTPQVERLSDQVRGSSGRGYTFVIDGVSQAAVETGANMAALVDGGNDTSVGATVSEVVTVAITLAADRQYSAVEIVPVTSPAQLVSSLLGLSGIIGAVGLVFTLAEALLEAKCGARRTSTSRRRLDGVLSAVGSGAGAAVGASALPTNGADSPGGAGGTPHETVQVVANPLKLRRGSAAPPAAAVTPAAQRGGEAGRRGSTTPPFVGVATAAQRGGHGSGYGGGDSTQPSAVVLMRQHSPARTALGAMMIASRTPAPASGALAAAAAAATTAGVAVGAAAGAVAIAT